MTDRKRRATVSLDLDNQWAYLRTRGDQDWKKFPSYLSIVGERIHEFFAARSLKPTIFVVGKDLELDDGREVVSSFSNLGFEIANHSNSHRDDFHLLDEREITSEIKRCDEKISDLTGTRPDGFRGPSFQMSKKIATILVGENYRYDASSYPTSIGPLARSYHFLHSNLSAAEKDKQRHLFGSFRSAFASLKPHNWQLENGVLREIPVTTMPLLRLPIHFTYLNFIADKSEVLATAYLNTALGLIRITGVQPSLLLHATDFLGSSDRPIPNFLPGMRREYNQKLKFLAKVFEQFDKYYEFSGIGASL